MARHGHLCEVLMEILKFQDKVQNFKNSGMKHRFKIILKNSKILRYQKIFFHLLKTLWAIKFNNVHYASNAVQL